MNTESSSLLVRDIGEQGLLQILQRFCPQEIIGDDAAVIATETGLSLVVTTDVLVDNIHFSEITTSAVDVGWRAAAANLSDLAAMGASPLGITVGLGLPGDVSVSWVEQMYVGMTQCLQQYNTPIVGGDVVRSPVITIAITAFGQAYPQQIIRRHRAQVGDAIIVTGVHGASRAGLELLLHPEKAENLSPEETKALIRAHQRPQPRLDVLPILWQILGSSQLAIAGMDSSDGLADALVQICRASNVGAVVERTQIPFPPAFAHWLTPEQALEYSLYGGEDFELVLCLPKEPADKLVQMLGQGAAAIGEITNGSTVVLRDQKQEFPDQVLSLSQEFQHFG
ncbi:thiamine-phosphate kinase [Fischerella thermalis]|uniref:thiamine-phosphate kinase n=2 Tax=Fischerella thermalis TaxID=372787 RepID=UPI0019F558D7|nr:thiamine-phosphate kinase [Fischerella thermalis]MBF1988831.1 thiamine-phosphate kinase [Fischerella thermalis M58_A2018_009]MBF2068111.1 thiamine-phosphate kinase [Fischerella thermalis M48_A2018_028]